ncbi:MAG: sugar ABC transporter ATP-binding protein [Spirochaetales bacterium]|nr:sugar ABC transporter ATP-binding protein [Spirochaetales bacterium]
MSESDIILEGRNLTKMYGGVHALKDVTFRLPRREVVALLGDNGAGKSTLVKILSGAISPTSGQVWVEGRKVEMANTRQAKELGIETVYQDLALVDCLSIEKNIYLGKEIVKKYLGVEVLQNRAMRNGALEFLAEVGINIDDPSRTVEQLSGGQRHAVAISKGAFWTEKILILDEPTAALGVKETERILDMILKLKKKGLSIIFITHNMEHAFLVADRFFVLRAGEKVGERRKQETGHEEVVKMITGAIFMEDAKV